MKNQTSIGQNTWAVPQKIDEETALFELLLQERRLKNPEDIGTFLNPTIKDLHDPFLMQGMEKATERIHQAIQKKNVSWSTETSTQTELPPR